MSDYEDNDYYQENMWNDSEAGEVTIYDYNSDDNTEYLDEYGAFERTGPRFTERKYDKYQSKTEIFDSKCEEAAKTYKINIDEEKFNRIKNSLEHVEFINPVAFVISYKITRDGYIDEIKLAEYRNKDIDDVSFISLLRYARFWLTQK